MTTNPIYFNLPGEQGHWNTAEDDEDFIKDGKSSRRNFLIFSILFSVVHASVDAVLAFSSAELGTKLGSSGGFTLYIFYTCSAFFLAKPLLQRLGAKRAVLWGLICMLAYVSMFFLAILLPQLALYVFLVGAAVGGTGAGLLWTAQGAYYSSNATEYSAIVDSNISQVLTRFAAMFAGIYLSTETAFKLLATAVCLSTSNSIVAWRPTVFGLYAVAAAIAIVLFGFLVMDFNDRIATDSDHEDRQQQMMDKQTTCSMAKEACKQALTVGKALLYQPKLQLLMPYQVCFGLTAGLVSTYVNGVIVKDQIGEGYIGLLAGITTLSAALLAPVFGMVSAQVEDGSYLLMIMGAVCFAAGGVMLITLSAEQIAYWPVIITYYVVLGVGRGVWENTNKAMVSIFFPVDEQRDAAYAAIYFSSGLAGALGFIFFQFLTKRSIAVINMSISLIALVCFHFGYQLHKRTVQEEALAHVHVLTNSCSRSASNSSLDSMVLV